MNTQPSTTVTAADESPSMAVIDLVAAVTGTDPVELDPLYDAIDPEVVDSLASSAGFSSLEFEYVGHTVVAEATDDGIEISLESVTIGEESVDVPGADPSA